MLETVLPGLLPCWKAPSAKLAVIIFALEALRRRAVAPIRFPKRGSSAPFLPIQERILGICGRFDVGRTSFGRVAAAAMHGQAIACYHSERKPDDEDLAMDIAEPTGSVLDPIDRMSEIVFGLLMALSFTGTMSAAVAGGQKVGGVLIAALGCNVAWGIVDGVMFVLALAVERARQQHLLTSIRGTPLPQARLLFLENLPEELRSALAEEEAETLLSRIRATLVVQNRRVVGFSDVKAAVLIFLLVVASTLPPSMPFFFIDELHRAMRVSNAIALVMLFVIGAQLGKYMGRKPWPMAFAMASIGAVLVVVTIAFGG